MQRKKISILVISLICVTAGIISACVTAPKAAKPTHYACDRGTSFSVTYTEKGFTTVRGGRNSMPKYEVKNVAANVTLADETLITLPVQKTASGFMYSNGRHTFRGEGSEAMWSVGRMLAERCEIKAS
ncbi:MULTISPECIES: MliC family protein [Methylotenera]|uniref:MliC family protein n=1 Tax=Methylotenera TaxID=359407 RepID=UPI00036E5CCD|nr:MULTISPECIES: MliC family protein [Methylotenera]